MGTSDQELEQLAEKYRWSIRVMVVIAAVIAAAVHADAVTPAWEKAGFWDRHIGQNVTNPAGVWIGYLLLAGLICWWAKVPARTMARSEAESRSALAAAQAAQTQHAEAKAQEERMRRLERETALQDGAERMAQSKEQLVRQLGSVDQFVRAWESETDASKRCMALQGAQSVLTTLQAKLAAGEIAPEAARDPLVLAMANETTQEVVRVGLGNDRLARDLRRVFGLSGDGHVDSSPWVLQIASGSGSENGDLR